MLFSRWSGPAETAPPGADHDSITVVDPFVRLVEPVAFRKVLGQVAALQRGGGSDHPAARLPGDVAQGHKTDFAVVPGRIDEDLQPLGIERVARQRHVALPADEATQPAGGRIDDSQAAGITHSPHHALRIGRHQLAMTVEKRAVGADDDHGIEQRRARKAAIDLVDPHHDGHRRACLPPPAAGANPGVRGRRRCGAAWHEVRSTARCPRRV